MQPEHDDPEDESEPPFSLVPDMANADIFLSGFAHPHFGHATVVCEKTSISKSASQRGQWYSYIGIYSHQGRRLPRRWRSSQ